MLKDITAPLIAATHSSNVSEEPFHILADVPFSTGFRYTPQQEAPIQKMQYTKTRDGSYSNCVHTRMLKSDE